MSFIFIGVDDSPSIINSPPLFSKNFDAWNSLLLYTEACIQGNTAQNECENRHPTSNWIKLTTCTRLQGVYHHTNEAKAESRHDSYRCRNRYTKNHISNMVSKIYTACAVVTFFQCAFSFQLYPDGLGRKLSVNFTYISFHPILHFTYIHIPRKLTPKTENHHSPPRTSIIQARRWHWSLPPLPNLQPQCPNWLFPQWIPLRAAQHRNLRSSLLVWCYLLQTWRSGNRFTIRRNRCCWKITIFTKRSFAWIGCGDKWYRCSTWTSLLWCKYPYPWFLNREFKVLDYRTSFDGRGLLCKKYCISGLGRSESYGTECGLHWVWRVLCWGFQCFLEEVISRYFLG